LFGLHAGLDEHDRHFAFDWLRLHRHPDRAYAPLADVLKEFVLATDDGVGGRVGVGALDKHPSLREAARQYFEKLSGSMGNFMPYLNEQLTSTETARSQAAMNAITAIGH